MKNEIYRVVGQIYSTICKHFLENFVKTTWGYSITGHLTDIIFQV